MKKFVVYWIRRISQTDIFCDGYIGISSNITQRWKRHQKHQSENPHLKRALETYNDVVFEVLFEGSQQHCEEIELYLRPNPNMGWNIAPGGNIPPSAQGRRWSDDHRRAYFETITNHRSNYRTPTQRAKMYATRKTNGFRPADNLNHEVIRGTVWWNNGSINKRAKESPGEGWVRGRISWKEII